MRSWKGLPKVPLSLKLAEERGITNPVSALGVRRCSSAPSIKAGIQASEDRDPIATSCAGAPGKPGYGHPTQTGCDGIKQEVKAQKKG